MSSIHEFATWAPVLRLLREAKAQSLAAGAGHVAGRISRTGWTLKLPRRQPEHGRASGLDHLREGFDAVEPVRRAFAEAGIDEMGFAADVSPDGRTLLHLFGPSPAVETGIGEGYPGALVLVEGARPEPWRRAPDPAPGAEPAPSADPALLERTLRERLPGAIGATEEEIDAAETRLGLALPEELKALYRAVSARPGDPDSAAVGCELGSLDELYLAEIPTRRFEWDLAAMKAVITPPDAAVQGLVGSPGWIVFGDNGGGDRLAVDLTPGPRGHVGQIIRIDHEQTTGADLLADSLTDFVLDRLHEERGSRGDRLPVVAHVNVRSLKSVWRAAHPDLEVLDIGVWDEEPLGLAPVAGLPRLRSLSAGAGALDDPLEIAGLSGLEYLELGPEDWRVLLDAGAVPRGLLAAFVTAPGGSHPLPIVTMANELLALRDRPQIPHTTLVGDLGPLPG